MFIVPKSQIEACGCQGRYTACPQDIRMMKLLLSVAEVMNYTKRIISKLSEKKSYRLKENEVSVIFCE